MRHSTFNITENDFHLTKRLGYHDGFITNVTRKQLVDNNESRPVLIYRIKYNDGDEEGEYPFFSQYFEFPHIL